MYRAKDLTGETFGHWTVLERGPNRKGQVCWLCRCRCGKEKICYASHLRHGKSRSCGCVHVAEMVKKRFRGAGELHQGVVSRIRGNARIRGHEFKVDVAYLWKLFEHQNRRCALTGWQISLPANLGAPAVTAATASLDRIDSSVGYVEGNVQWVHKDVNMMKRTLSQDRFVEVCSAVGGYTSGTVLLPQE